MRRAIERLLLTLTLAILPLTTWAAEWSTPRFMSDPAFQSQIRFNFGRAIAVDAAGVVHAVWLEMASTEGTEIYPGRVMYSHSADDGRNWSAAVPLTGQALAPTAHPKIAAA